MHLCHTSPDSESHERELSLGVAYNQHTLLSPPPRPFTLILVDGQSFSYNYAPLLGCSGFCPCISPCTEPEVFAVVQWASGAAPPLASPTLPSQRFASPISCSLYNILSHTAFILGAEAQECSQEKAGA